MSAAMEAFCIRMRPPDPPLFLPLEARNRLLQFRQNHAAFVEYEQLCNLTIRTSSQPSSTPDPVVSRVTTLQTVTSDVTNVSSVNNDTFLTPITDLEDLYTIGSEMEADSSSVTPSSGSSAWIAAVVIAILVIAVIVLVVGWMFHKKKKSHDYQALFEQYLGCFYKGPQRNRGSVSLEEKSRGGSSFSGEENQTNGRSNEVVFSNQVTADIKDFKHASTAQLIDECSFKNSKQDYDNPLINTLDIELKEIEEFETQTDSDVTKEKDKCDAESQETVTSSNPEKNCQFEDSYIHLRLSGGERDSRTYDRCDQPPDQPPDHEQSQSTPKDTQSTADLKSSLDIDLNSNTAVSDVGKGPVIESQASVDSGYTSRLASPQEECD